MLVGHQKIRSRFDKLLVKDNLAHAYLFVGPEAVGKAFFASYLAQKICCPEAEAPCDRCSSCRLIESGNHPDLIVLEPKIEEKGGKTVKQKISIGQVRSLRKQISLVPFQATKKIAIIKDAEFISGEAANAFLKILEEPPQNTILILVSSSSQAILPTLRSRCQAVNFSFLSKDEMNRLAQTQPEFGQLSNHEKSLLLEMSAGRPGFLLTFLRDSELKKFFYQQGQFFKEIFELSVADRFLKLEKTVGDQRRLNWVMFFWLLLGHQALKRISGLETAESLDKFLPQKAEASRLVNFLKQAQTMMSTINNNGLNQRLLLENLLLNI